MKMHVWLVLLLVALAPSMARAGGDEVVVVYNKKMPQSKAVAEDYAKMRDVPPTQVFGFALPTDEVMSREEFKEELQWPLAIKLKSSGLWTLGVTTIEGADGRPVHFIHGVVSSKIRYAVLCYGVPLKIADDADIHEAGDANPKFPSWLLGNGASVDSELAWLPLLENAERLSGPMPNRLYGVTNADLLDPTNGILLVTRLDGPSADIAMGLVKKSLEAEQNGLWGRAYFDARGITSGNYAMGDEWILKSADLSRRMGFETIVDNNPDTFPADFPMSQIALYAGWYAGDACGPFAQPTVEFMPGAFAYHLQSYSAATLRSTTQNWCGPLLAKGATCTMGCVDEPNLDLTPNVIAFLARWMLDHFTYAEAAWAAQPALSWQTTVIGDPLYCPFAKEPKELHEELEQSHNPLLEWSYLRVANLAHERGVSDFQVENFLENLPITDSSPVLTEKLGDLCDTQGKPDSAADFYQRALKLNPSPEQRIRLRLALAREFIALAQPADAIQDYKELLVEAPAYPGKDSVCGKIAALQQKVSGAH
jgi:uncharacterized protein (TIGR03790 family)